MRWPSGRPPAQAGRYDLFFNVGSPDNNADSTATVPVSGLINGQPQRRFDLQGHRRPTPPRRPSLSNLTQIATGLRNAAGIVVHPATGDLFFEDNGIDGLRRRERADRAPTS